MNQRTWASILLVTLTTNCALAEADFVTLSRDLATQAANQGTQVVEGQNDWLFLAPELRHIAAGPFWGDAAQNASQARRADARDPLPAILDFHQALEDIGVHLLMVPVPLKAVVHADKLLPDALKERPDTAQAEFIEVLRSSGIDVLDLTDEFRSQPVSERGPLYCRTDTHWSGKGIVTAAQQIAAAIPEAAELATDTAWQTEWSQIEIEGDLNKMRDESGDPESLWVRRVEADVVDSSSPVLLLGDSHTLVFHAGGDMHATRAGLPEQLAFELGTPVDLIGVRGSGATPARINLFRRAQRDPDFWSDKQVVVWVFAGREFTQSDGWRIVPIQR